MLDHPCLNIVVQTNQTTLLISACSNTHPMPLTVVGLFECPIRLKIASLQPGGLRRFVVKCWACSILDFGREIEREQWRKRSFLCKISPLHSPLWLFHFLSVSPLPKVSLWIYEDCQVHRLQHHWITIYKSHTTTCSFEHLNGIFCNQWVQTTRQVFFITNLNRQVSKQVFVLCDSSCQLCASVLIDNSREYKFS